MKFKSEPNLYVRIANLYVQRATGKKGFYFDDKGEFETENEILIKLLKRNFEVIEEKELTIKLKQCKKCDFECETQGQLLAHYKKDHKKE